MNSLKVALAAEFELCEKISETLEQSGLVISQLSIVEIYPFGEEQAVRFNNRAVAQILPDDINWADFDYLLFAGKATEAAHIANAAEAGCVVIDLNAVCANIAGVPVVVPSVNDEQLAIVRQRNIVSLPDPQVSQLALVLAGLLDDFPINQIFISSLLPASYQGSESIKDLAGQTARLLNGIPVEEQEQRLAFDVFPQSSAHLSEQLQKIFPTLNSFFHAVQVPVFYGLAQKITATLDYPVELDKLELWQDQSLIQQEQSLLTPVLNGEKEGSEENVKLHLSAFTAVENTIEFWTVADEQRFSLALLSVNLLQRLLQQAD